MIKKTLIRVFVCWLIVLQISPSAFAAETPIKIETDRVSSNLPSGIIFNLTAESETDIEHITLLYGTEGRSCHEGLNRQEIPLEPAQKMDVQWELEFENYEVLPPGAQGWWQWEIEDAAGNTLITEKNNFTVEDQRRQWKEKSTNHITVRWYQGSDSFGAKVLEIATSSIRRLEDDMGIQFDESIRINIYPDSEAMKEVLIHSQEWAGAVAFSNYNTILLGITNIDMIWAKEVIPHELSHLVTEMRIFNCKGYTIPIWLNEGLAMVAQGDISSYEKQIVFQALQTQKLPTLNSLINGFSAYSEDAVLSYEQCGMTVEYLISEYGSDKMDLLLKTIQSGNTIDEALQAVYGFDTNGLDSAWRVSLGFDPLDIEDTAPHTVSTRTQVPTLALYTSPVRITATATLSPTIITPTLEPSTELYPTATNTPLPTKVTNYTGVSNWGIIVGIAVGLLIILAIVFFVYLRRRRE